MTVIITTAADTVLFRLFVKHRGKWCSECSEAQIRITPFASSGGAGL